MCCNDAAVNEHPQDMLHQCMCGVYIFNTGDFISIYGIGHFLLVDCFFCFVVQYVAWRFCSIGNLWM